MSYSDIELAAMRVRAETMIEGGAHDADELLELLAKLIQGPGAVSAVGRLAGFVIALATEHVDSNVQWRVEIYKTDVDCAWLVLKLHAVDGHEFVVSADFTIADATRPDFESWAARKMRQASRGILNALEQHYAQE